MDINQFSIYSKLSSFENPDKEIQFFELLTYFEQIKDCSEAKKCLEKSGINKDVKNFSFGNNRFISVQEDMKRLSVKFDYDKKHISYNYKKD